MKNYKRISAVLCALVLLSQFILPSVYAERVVSELGTEAEVIEKADEMISDTNRKEFAALYELGIISGNAESDRIVTRGEFAGILYSINKPYVGSTLGFRDVDPDSEIAEAIKSASAYGYMSGYGDGSFRPNEPISYTETIYALLTMAGYGKVAEIKGGYPGGYHFIAAEKKLGTDCSDSSRVTYGEMVKILYNFLSTNVMKLSVKSNGEEVMLESEMTVIEEFLNLYQGKGVVYANEHIAIMGRKKTDEGKAIVGYENKDSMIEVGNSGIDEYVGYYVRYYLNEEDEIVYCRPYEGRYKKLEITEEQIYGIDKNLLKLEYNDNGKANYANISSKADFVYNGASCYEITSKDIETADYISLIDNDMDCKYDVVYIVAYASYMVGNISYKERIVQDQRENMHYFFDEDRAEVVYIKNGVKTDISIIKEWDILNIEESRESEDKLVKVNVSSDVISGDVEGIDYNNRILTIDGEKHFLSKKIDIKSIVKNTDVVCGLNEFGAIVCIKHYKRDREYAYLTNIMRKEKEDEIVIKVINQAGMSEEIVFADRFYVNNQKGTWESLAGCIENYTPSADSYGSYKANYQLIAYNLNNAGELKRLYTSQEVKGAREELYNGELVLNKTFSGARIRAQYPTINAEYVYEKNTPIFIMVTDNETNEIIEEFCCIKTKDTLDITEGSRPKIKVYDAGKDRIAKVMVMELKQAELSSYFDLTSRQGFLITDIRSVVNEDGDVVNEYVGISNGQEVSYRENDYYDFSQWKVGDLWIIKRELNSSIVGATKLFELKSEEGSTVMSPNMDYSENKSIRDLNSSSGTTDYTETHTGVFGRLASVMYLDNIPTIRVTLEGLSEDVVYGVTGTSIVIYRKNETFEPISFENLSVGIGSGKIFCYTRYGICRDIIIIE